VYMVNSAYALSMSYIQLWL